MSDQLKLTTHREQMLLVAQAADQDVVGAANGVEDFLRLVTTRIEPLASRN